jgi:hypothetical protein
LIERLLFLKLLVKIQLVQPNLKNAICTAPPCAKSVGTAPIGPGGRPPPGVGALFTPLAVPGVGTLPCKAFTPVDLLRAIRADRIARGRPKTSSN